MATVTGFTAARMEAMEDATIVDGSVVGDNLILEKHDGSTVNAGNVRGPAGPIGNPSRVSSLPGSPADGDEVYYIADAAAGVIWHLKYNAGSASTYKWEFLGGAPMYNEGGGGTTASAVYQTAGAATLTLARAGDYMIEFVATITNNTANPVNQLIGVHDDGVLIGGAELNWVCPATSGISQDQGNKRRCLAIGAGSIIDLRYKNANSLSSSFTRLRLNITPIRVI